MMDIFRRCGPAMMVLFRRYGRPYECRPMTVKIWIFTGIFLYLIKNLIKNRDYQLYMEILMRHIHQSFFCQVARLYIKEDWF